MKAAHLLAAVVAVALTACGGGSDDTEPCPMRHVSSAGQVSQMYVCSEVAQ